MINLPPLYIQWTSIGGGWEDRTPTSCLQSTCAPIITNPPKMRLTTYLIIRHQSGRVLAPQDGIEPPTFWLTARRNYRCATEEYSYTNSYSKSTDSE